MPKKASKEQLFDWKLRLEASKTIMKIAEQLIEDVDEEHEIIKAEMKEYGMLESED